MYLIGFLARVCYYAQEIISEDNPPKDVEHMMCCTSHAIACFLAQNTKFGDDGVETDVVLKELCEIDKKYSLTDWEDIIKLKVNELGGEL